MGKKSREKRERKAAKANLGPQLWPEGFESSIAKKNSRDAEIEDKFQKHVEQTRQVFLRYRRMDTALALCASDLWPANVASPVKHMFAWAVLLRAGDPVPDALPIETYEEFESFAKALYAVWPEFPMLEDFSPEADWGQTKVRLGSDFVPIFYGSSIERIPDFMEAFRISYAGVGQAQIDMDLVVATQAHIIQSIPYLASAPPPNPRKGEVNIPSKEFWLACRPAIGQLSRDLVERRVNANKELETDFGQSNDPLTHEGFGNAVLEGTLLPFISVIDGEHWVPISVRSMPGVVIDHWAARHTGPLEEPVHKMLGRFVAERFSHTRTGPFTLVIDGHRLTDLQISCFVSTGSGVYLVCACDHRSYPQTSEASRRVYAALNKRKRVHFVTTEGPNSA